MTTLAAPREIALATYTVTIGSGALARIGELVESAARAHRYAVVSDRTVAPLYAQRVAHALGPAAELFTVEPGEQAKTRESWASLTDAMLGADFGRDTTIVAVGGGVVGDLAGFVAATFMRGVTLVQVPTTLLAMVDASVGGKVGVDTPAGKNLVGAFHPPAAVIADPVTLRTLPLAHRRAGLAEVLKHGIVADKCYFEEAVGRMGTLLDEGADAELALADTIARSVEIKAKVVGADEREAGVRKVLNFGHTIAHALEMLSGFAMLHGEAVAIGMVAEAALGERLGVTEPGTSGRVAQGVLAAGLPALLPPGMGPQEVVAATRADKKARGGMVEYALPRRIGAMAGQDRGYGIAVRDADALAVLEGMALHEVRR